LVLDQFTKDGIVVDKALGFWLNRVYQRTRSEMYRVFAEHGEDVTPEQWMLLIRLWERDGMSQNEVSELTLRDAPTISRILRVMEGRGYIERRTSEVDGRMQLVHLTRRGKALKRKLVPLVRDLVERTVRGIDRADLAQLRRTLERMFENLEPRES
jgi:MarR family transcriptional regulator, organic hydroperoxide resistance regulator